MTVEEDRNVRALRESRDGVRSLQFFVAAMAAQLHDLHDKLEDVHLDVTGLPIGSPAPASNNEELAQLEARAAQLEQENESLRAELERRNVTFADHHAAKREIARLQEELAVMRGETSLKLGA